MPSFDVVSQVDQHELSNAVDQTNRDISKRFDFKGTGAHVEQAEFKLTSIAPAEFQLQQIFEILQGKLSKRDIDIACLEVAEPQASGKETRQEITVRHGIDKELAKRIVKLVKEKKLKVQTSIQDEQVRVTGKKRDDLQTVIALLRKEDLGLPLQFINFRD